MLIDQAIDAFWQCARQRVPVPPEWIGRFDRDTAYRVQLGVLAHHVRAGDRHVGWKVGLTAKAMQIQQGVHEPVFGFLLASGDRPSGAKSVGLHRTVMARCSPGLFDQRVMLRTVATGNTDWARMLTNR